jgi:hypothetical protein
MEIETSTALQYRLKGLGEGASEKLKYTLLKSYIDYYLSKETSDNEVVYLFY